MCDCAAETACVAHATVATPLWRITLYARDARIGVTSRSAALSVVSFSHTHTRVHTHTHIHIYRRHYKASPSRYISTSNTVEWKDVLCVLKCTQIERRIHCVFLVISYNIFGIISMCKCVKLWWCFVKWASGWSLGSASTSYTHWRALGVITSARTASKQWENAG